MTRFTAADLSALIESDPIAALFLLVKEAGGTMTLHGVPVGEGDLRAAALESVIERMAPAAGVRICASCPNDVPTGWRLCAACFVRGGGQ